jgi:hypothetical protein
MDHAWKYNLVPKIKTLHVAVSCNPIVIIVTVSGHGIFKVC